MEAETNPVHFPNPRFAPTADPGADLALMDNLGLVLERIVGIAELLQSIGDDTPPDAIQNVGFMLENEAHDAKVLLEKWDEAKRKG